jgi:outer membrane biosynthesis protein TonB
MTHQRLLLLIAAVAALALVFGLPRIFEETDEAAVPPVQLREDAPTRTPDPPPRRERPKRTPAPTPEATATPEPPPPPAPAPPPAPPPAGDDDDDGGED